MLCLALGIGATTTMLSVANAAVVRGLPNPHADRLMMIYEQRPQEGVSDNVVSFADFFDWRASNTVFASMAAWEGGTAAFTRTGAGDPDRVPGVLLAVAASAAVIPARRAAGVEPVVALRHD